MKLEFLQNGSPDCPLIRLYFFTQEQAGSLHHTLFVLSDKTLKTVALHKELGVEQVGHRELNLLVGRSNRGNSPNWTQYV